MLKLTYELICSIIQVSTFFVFLKTIFRDSKVIPTSKVFISFVFLMLVTVIVHSSEYQGIYTLLIFLLLTLILFLLYKFSITKSFLTSGVFMAILFLADIFTSIIFITFANVEELRGQYLIYANLLVSCIAILLFLTPVVRRKLLAIIRFGETNKSLEIVIFIILLICALSIIMHIVGRHFYLSEIYALGVVGIIIFLILSLIFCKEKYEKNKLITKYDQLFEYVNTFEEWIDIENMNLHESKNQLAVLREIVKKNKKATEYIDNIITERSMLELTSQKLKYIPNGGLRGLLCYKLTIAENNNIDFVIDVSSNLKNEFLRLTIDENKDLCRIVGILLDNSIEALKESKNKVLSCEIYVSNNKINIVISNQYIGNIELEKIKMKGYSTKGANRGKGLHFINKILKKSKLFHVEYRVINDYFIQRIIINKKISL